MSDATQSDGEFTSGPTVFISYRRADTDELAQRLSVLLREDLGGGNVFRDKDDIIVGDRWKDTLVESMEGSDATIFLVGDRWVGQRDDGTRRIDEQDDTIRGEVHQALDEETASAPLPFLVDVERPPEDLPADIRPLFDDYQYARISRAGLDAQASAGYQGVLVGIWHALQKQRPNGVLILGDRTEIDSLDALVSELDEGGQFDARLLSRFASGAYVASVRESKRLTRKWPDVIVNIGEEGPNEELRGRLAALAANPGIRSVTLVGAGAAAGMAVAGTLGASTTSAATFTQSSSAQLVSGITQPAGASAGSAWASAGIGAKVAAIAAATVITAGAVVGIARVVDGDPPRFSEITELAPMTIAGDGYPLGEPDAITVRLGSAQPVGEEETTAYFGRFPGGTAERRSVELEYQDMRLALGDIVIPISYPSDFVERNVGVFRIARTDIDGETQLVAPGTGAAGPCSYEGTGDTVGGWVYTGEPGLVSLDLLFESDGGSVNGIGMRVTFDGPADVIFFEDVIEAVIPDDVNINDRCTPVDRLASSWVQGVAQSE